MLDTLESLRNKARERRKRTCEPVSRNKQNKAVEAFWAMHVEAMNWSGVSAKDYAAAHHISVYTLRTWRARLDADPLRIDWRARLRPSVRAKISKDVSSAAKDRPTETVLTDVAKSDPPRDRRSNRRNFTDEEKLSIVLETEQPGTSMAAICRQYDIATSMVFRWRIQFGFCEKKRAKLAAVKLADGQTSSSSTPLMLHDLIPPPDGMTVVELDDGRRVFAPVGSDPDAVRRHVLEQEAVR
ncbi:transposase [Methylocapsa sp. D3K7]|uniref:IS66 family insertion sequence element accessory protein TnpA n=1 Tax=Methylocapsa sp. D3K7 TaxID=3041435 RepID=UPI00244EEED7|nr:transposase [Methylocapsa sp. D3K7]WGJ13320.1 transposase [Methylocapsa sp. D3K7]